MKLSVMAVLLALVTGLVLPGCETPGPVQPAPDYAAIQRNCLAEGGALNSYAVAFYECMSVEARRLAPSGGSAGEISLAAAVACDSQRSRATSFASACRQYYASAAGLQVLEEFGRQLDAKGAGAAARAVLQSRIPPGR